VDSARILISAALPYANGPIHLGHLAGAYLPSDMYARYQRLKGRDVLFVCGSDEHGVPITISADREGITPQQVVDRYHAQNHEAFRAFDMSFDTYSRTSLPLHHETARSFLVDFHERGILTEKTERHFYDEKAEMFLPDRYVEGTCPVCSSENARGDQCEQCGSYLNPSDLINPRSKISGGKPVFRETAHLYFPLGKYQKRLEEYIAERDKRDGWKENVLSYCRSWFQEGLQDRAVTRDLDWGVRIPLKGYEKKVLYVWFDAVLGYVSASKDWAQQQGKPHSWKHFWHDPSTKYVAFIGKDNVVFHCIVFPAMLMAWNDGHREQFVLPENVPANEFLNFEGQKFSKSRGWGIDVQDFLERFPADPLRYYLATALPEYRDSDFYWKDFQARNNNELLAILGNYVHRTLTFAHARCGGVVPPRSALNEHDRALLEEVRKAPVTAGRYFEEYRFRDGLLEIMNLARRANKYFNDSEPWKSIEADPERCMTTINLSLQLIRTLAILISPVCPSTSGRMMAMLNLEAPGGNAWDHAGELKLQEQHTLGTPTPIVSRIEDDVIEKEREPFAVKEAAEASPQPEDSHISIDDFKKIDLRVARVIACEKVEDAKKLLKLLVRLDGEERQVVAGIAESYDPTDLVGKSVVLVANLKPAKIRGLVSQGMILAAAADGGRLVLVMPESETDPGASVR